MRAIFITLAAILIVVWLGFEQRRDRPQLAVIAFTVAALLSMLLVGAFFGLY